MVRSIERQTMVSEGDIVRGVFSETSNIGTRGTSALSFLCFRNMFCLLLLCKDEKGFDVPFVLSLRQMQSSFRNSTEIHKSRRPSQ